MKIEFENALYSIDPVFFEHAINCQEGKENEMTTCMYFGCECGDGWFEPLKKFVNKISIINGLAKEYNTKFVCDQLKEKFGEVTIYYSCIKIDETKEVENQEYIDILSDMVDEAYHTCIDDCWNTCEWCGAEGGYNGENLVTTQGWISRICKKCAKDKAEKETKRYDEYHNQEYLPRITWFHEGYEFLNLYHICSFEYYDKVKFDNNVYHSIIEAFYCMKDSMHRDIYQQIGRESKNAAPYIIQNIANAFGYKYNDTEVDYKLLKDIVKSKFSYEWNKNIKQELLETEGKLLQNMSRNHNNILGYCVCEKCKDQEHKDFYAKILMEVRDEFIKECKNEK